MLWTFKPGEIDEAGRNILAVMLIAPVLCAQKPESQPGKSSDDSGGRVTKAVQLVRAVEAPCPPGGERSRHIVAVDVLVDADGKVQQVRRLNAVPSAVDEAAVEAVKQYTFSAGTRDGVPAPMHRIVYVEFPGTGKPGTAIDTRPTPPLVQVAVPVSPTNEAYNQHIHGDVFVSVLVTERGSVSEVQVVRHLPAGLDDRAVEAVKRYRFKPGEIDGQPVPARVTIAVGINFN